MYMPIVLIFSIYQAAREWLIIRIIFYYFAIKHRIIQVIIFDCVICKLFIRMFRDVYISFPYCRLYFYNIHLSLSSAGVKQHRSSIARACNACENQHHKHKYFYSTLVPHTFVPPFCLFSLNTTFLSCCLNVTSNLSNMSILPRSGGTSSINDHATLALNTSSPRRTSMFFISTGTTLSPTPLIS